MSKKSVTGTTTVGILSSILAFLGVVSCCGMPIVAGILAWVGIGASQLVFFAEYRAWFLALAIIALMYGFWKVYFKKSAFCCDKQPSCCGNGAKSDGEQIKPKRQIVQKIFLFIGAAVVILSLIMGDGASTAIEPNPLAPTFQIEELSQPPIEPATAPTGCCPAQ